MDKLKQILLKLPFMNQARYGVFMYLVMGGLTTLVNILCFWFFESIIGMEYGVANVIAWFFSVVFAYITNKKYVFESQHESSRELVREIGSFFAFRVLSLIIDQLTMYVCISILSMSSMIAKVLANIVVVAANYVFSKLFIFKKRK